MKICCTTIVVYIYCIYIEYTMFLVWVESFYLTEMRKRFYIGQNVL